MPNIAVLKMKYAAFLAPIIRLKYAQYNGCFLNVNEQKSKNESVPTAPIKENIKMVHLLMDLWKETTALSNSASNSNNNI